MNFLKTLFLSILSFTIKKTSYLRLDRDSAKLKGDFSIILPTKILAKKNLSPKNNPTSNRPLDD